jgi:hypothetical protein
VSRWQKDALHQGSLSDPLIASPCLSKVNRKCGVLHDTRIRATDQGIRFQPWSGSSGSHCWTMPVHTNISGPGTRCFRPRSRCNCKILHREISELTTLFVTVANCFAWVCGFYFLVYAVRTVPAPLFTHSGRHSIYNLSLSDQGSDSFRAFCCILRAIDKGSNVDAPLITIEPRSKGCRISSIDHSVRLPVIAQDIAIRNLRNPNFKISQCRSIIICPALRLVVPHPTHL